MTEEACDQFADLLAEATRQCSDDAMRSLLEFEQSICYEPDADFTLLRVGRRLLHDDVIQLTNATDGTEDYAHMFLFNDFIVFLQHCDDETQFTYLRHAPLAAITVMNRVEGSLSFELQQRSNILVITTESLQEKAEWLHALRTAKDALARAK
jgi:hypothetical protein